jgi:hypothetical protein
MSIMSKAAFAALLTLGSVAAVVATPADAQRNKKKAEGGAPELKVGEEFRKAAVAAQTAVQAKDYATAETQLAAAEALIQNDDERYFAASLRLPIEAQKQNNTGMKNALDVLLNSPRTAATDLPRLTFVRGTIALNEKDFAGATQYLSRARELNYANDELPLLIARAQFDQNNIPGGVAEMQKAVEAKKAAGQKVPDEWYDYTVAKLYGAKQPKETAQWLRMQLTDYPTAKNWRRSLLVFRDSAQLDNSAQMNLFRLMRSTKSLADQNDYLEYADLAYRIGLPFETKAVIDEGRAAGKIPASSGTANSIYGEAQTAIRNEGSLTALEKPAQSAANGTKAKQLADAYLASGNNAKAVEYYRIATQKGGVNAQEVSASLGVALANSGQRAEAKQAFAGVTTAPGNEIATFWNLWIDQGMAAPAA